MGKYSHFENGKLVDNNKKKGNRTETGYCERCGGHGIVFPEGGPPIPMKCSACVHGERKETIKSGLTPYSEYKPTPKEDFEKMKTGLQYDEWEGAWKSLDKFLGIYELPYVNNKCEWDSRYSDIGEFMWMQKTGGWHQFKHRPSRNYIFLKLKSMTIVATPSNYTPHKIYWEVKIPIMGGSWNYGDFHDDKTYCKKLTDAPDEQARKLMYASFPKRPVGWEGLDELLYSGTVM